MRQVARGVLPSDLLVVLQLSIQLCAGSVFNRNCNVRCWPSQLQQETWRSPHPKEEGEVDET